MIASSASSIYTSVHQNVNGKDLLLRTVHYDANRLCVEYVVENAKLYTINDFLVTLPLVIVFLMETVLEYRTLGYDLLFLVTLYYSLSRLLWKVHKECILIIAYTGLQIKVVYASGQQTARFIPWSTIKDVIIQECFVKQRVLYYLSVLMEKKGNNEAQTMLLPLLTETSPRLSGIENIYCDIQKVLEKKT